MSSIGQTGEILGINYAPLSLSGSFTLTLYDSPESSVEKTIMQYTFYITPQDIQITKPGRLSVYQSIGGAAHIDHLGEGLVAITISGITGFNPLVGPAGFVQYSLLRNIVDLYYDRCKNGFAAQSRLELAISFPDYPNYGTWDVTVKDMNLSRSAQMPLINKYTVSFIAISDDKTKAWRAKFATTNETRVRTSGESDIVTEALNAIYNISKKIPYSVVTYAVTEINKSLNDVIKLFYNESLTDDQINQVKNISGIDSDTDLAVGTIVYLPVFK